MIISLSGCRCGTLATIGRFRKIDKNNNHCLGRQGVWSCDVSADGVVLIERI